ncbi:MAG: C4-type zinc ribbon domain-containing protein [Cytophagaceae bacterium]|nr:C4-type zinc ribbon domain-containing protein [Cytophagaceae bacterium]
METTIAQRLDALLKLQQIDSKLDEIKKIRGDLPEEVRDLEDEIIGYETRIGKFQRDVDTLEEEIGKHKLAKKDAEKLIAKYKEQQMNVRNNREYDAITKEIELQQLEMELSDKRIAEANFKISTKQDEVQRAKDVMTERRKDLDSKKGELNTIIGESEAEEKGYVEERQQKAGLVEERLFRSYEKIRNNAVNGLAVVTVRRGACGGCFNVVPPQRQADIKDKKKIIVCEHCGRILADVEEAAFAPSGRR